MSFEGELLDSVQFEDVLKDVKRDSKTSTSLLSVD